MAVKQGVYAGVSAADRVALRRSQLLDATLEVWGRDGGLPITMTRVCAEAGLTERYFYESFANLDAARAAVMERIGDEIAERTVAVLEATSGEPTERVRAAIGEFVRILTDDPRKGRVAIVESAAIDALRERRAALLRQFTELAAREARELYGPRAWSEQERQLSATMFIGGVAELVTAWIEGVVKASPEEIVATATHHFIATAQR